VTPTLPSRGSLWRAWRCLGFGACACASSLLRCWPSSRQLRSASVLLLRAAVARRFRARAPGCGSAAAGPSASAKTGPVEKTSTTPASPGHLHRPGISTAPSRRQAGFDLVVQARSLGRVQPLREWSCPRGLPLALEAPSAYCATWRLVSTQLLRSRHSSSYLVKRRRAWSKHRVRAIGTPSVLRACVRTPRAERHRVG
jgi:hypothetical protein